MQLSWGCEEQLFRQELEDADDIRLSVRLYTLCIREKRKFCGDVPPGGWSMGLCVGAEVTSFMASVGGMWELCSGLHIGSAMSAMSHMVAFQMPAPVGCFLKVPSAVMPY